MPASSCRSTIRGSPRITTARRASVAGGVPAQSSRAASRSSTTRLRGIPAERVRFHTCYSINVAPRVHDMELKDFVDLMLQIKRGRLLDRGRQPPPRARVAGLGGREAARTTKSSSRASSPTASRWSSIPELVAQRIARFASVVGRERVIASNDCGFATSAAGDEPIRTSPGPRSRRSQKAHGSPRSGCGGVPDRRNAVPKTALPAEAERCVRACPARRPAGQRAAGRA